MTASFDPRKLNLNTAFDELGHAWGYVHTGKLLRFVTVRPLRGINLGRCIGWEPGATLWAVGPIAEAHWGVADYASPWVTFESALAYVIEHGGQAHWRHLVEIFADPDDAARLRSAMVRDCALIEALANKLMVVGRMTGAQVYELWAPMLFGLAS